MGKTISGIIVPSARMTADDNAKMALQTLLFAELRQASQRRQERAGWTVAAFAGVAIGAVISAAYIAAPFFGL